MCAFGNNFSAEAQGERSGKSRADNGVNNLQEEIVNMSPCMNCQSHYGSVLKRGVFNHLARNESLIPRRLVRPIPVGLRISQILLYMNQLNNHCVLDCFLVSRLHPG